ncbi:MAG: carbohydrate ABC transporter permease [Streptosporangiaceae bacterium]
MKGIRRDSTTGFGFSVPALIVYVGFAVIPMGVAAYLSLVAWDGLSEQVFVGLANWRRLLGDPVAGRAITLSVEMMVLSWVVQTPVSLLLGVFMAGRQRYREVLGAIYFLPLLFSAVAIGITWQYILDPNFGVVDNGLEALGLSALAKNWLGDPGLAFYTLVLLIAWQFIPFHSLLYQAGVRQIPRELYEAAEIDGAGAFARFFRITLPQLKYTVVTSTTLILTGSLTYFDLIFVTTGGGPGYATRVLPLDMYIRAFGQHEMGYGSVLAVLIAGGGVVLSLLLLKLTGFTRMTSRLEGL